MYDRLVRNILVDKPRVRRHTLNTMPCSPPCQSAAHRKLLDGGTPGTPLPLGQVTRYQIDWSGGGGEAEGSAEAGAPMGSGAANESMAVEQPAMDVPPPAAMPFEAPMAMAE